MDKKLHNSMRKTLAELFPEKYESITKKKVYIVSGAPGAGKTTYVHNHKTNNDLVVDMDYICAALNATSSLYQNHEPVLSVALQLQELLYQVIENREGKWENAWVITATSNQRAVKQLARRLEGEIIPLETPLNQCIRNIQSDSRRNGSKERMINLAQKWFSDRDN